MLGNLKEKTITIVEWWKKSLTGVILQIKSPHCIFVHLYGARKLFLLNINMRQIKPHVLHLACCFTDV